MIALHRPRHIADTAPCRPRGVGPRDGGQRGELSGTDGHRRDLERRRAGDGPPTVPANPEPLRFGDVEIDPRRHSVWKGGDPVELSPREYDLLLCLLGHDGALDLQGRGQLAFGEVGLG